MLFLYASSEDVCCRASDEQRFAKDLLDKVERGERVGACCLSPLLCLQRFIEFLVAAARQRGTNLPPTCLERKRGTTGSESVNKVNGGTNECVAKKLRQSFDCPKRRYFSVPRRANY